MRHKKLGRRFSRDSSHRQAMFSNMAASLIKHEQIITTLHKAKDLKLDAFGKVTRLEPRHPETMKR